MRFFYTCLFGALIVLTVATPVLAAEIVLPAGTLKGPEIEALVAGKTIRAEDAEKNVREIFFFPEGEIRQVRANGDYEKGKWRVKEDRLCISAEGDRDCRIVVKQNNAYRTYVVKLDNKHQLEETFVAISSGNQVFARMKKSLTEGVALPKGTLNAEEVLQLFYDRTVESVTAAQERESRSYYAPNGEVNQYRNDKKRTGKWGVKENGRICLEMEDLPGKCRIIVYENGEYRKYIVKKNGQHIHSVSYPKFRKGNPYHL